MKGCHRLLLTVLVVIVVASASASTRAEVLIDTLLGDQTGSPSPTAYFNHNFPSVNSPADDLRTAIPFTVGQGKAYALDAIVLNVAARNNASQHLTVTLSRPDAGGLPGASVGVYGVTNLPVRLDTSGPITYPFTYVPTPDHPLLTAGKYWIALSTPDLSFQSDIYWYNRDDLSGRVGVLSSPLNGTAWTEGTGAPLPQLRVLATLVPEPTCLPLLVSSVLLLKRRR
jgi:hypothetical protein